MLLDRLRYEIRVIRWPVVLMPTFILLGCILAVTILRLGTSKTIGLLTACLEMILPLAAGIIVAMLTGSDTAMELQLTMPTPYWRTVLRRLTLIVGGTALISLLESLTIGALKLDKYPTFLLAWSPIWQVLTAQLVWLSPLLWFVGVGLCFSLLLQSRMASSALLGGVWVAENIIYGLFIGTEWLHPVFLFTTTLTPLVTMSSFWLSNRIELAATGIAFFVLGWLQLRNTERLLRGVGGAAE